jgi:hypothetical protein
VRAYKLLRTTRVCSSEQKWGRFCERRGAMAAGIAGATAAAEGASASPIPVAILLGPNATLIDFAGPWEILGAASYSCPGFNAYSVAATPRAGALR